ncbi:MAG: hypothetical protein HOH43_09320 [Candidatus Latescibacteria bacterium]|nr:hypothetical protein [Candidatus Latescibacterota bacterium]
MRLPEPTEGRYPDTLDTRFRYSIDGNELAYIDAYCDMLIQGVEDSGIRSVGRRSRLTALANIMRDVSIQASYDAHLN